MYGKQTSLFTEDCAFTTGRKTLKFKIHLFTFQNHFLFRWFSEMKEKSFDSVLINLNQDIFFLLYFPCPQKQLLFSYITKQRALADWCLQNKDSLKISWHLHSEFTHLRHVWNEFSSTVCLQPVQQEDGDFKCMQYQIWI